jgi:hypothetical protein
MGVGGGGGLKYPLPPYEIFVKGYQAQAHVY